MMTKIVRVTGVGGSEVLRVQEEPIPEPAAGEVRIRVERIGLNRAENLYHRGMYLYPPKIGSTLGYEAVGVVEAVGPGVRDVEIGSSVSTIPSFSMQDYGVYGETAIVPAYAAAKYPPNLSPEEAASSWMQYVTAYGGLVHDGRLQKGETVLLTAATGGLGVASIQIARMIGATSIATTRQPEKVDFLKSLGPDHVILTGRPDQEDMVARVMDITGGNGVNLIFEAVLGPVLAQLAEVAAYQGRIIT